MAYSYKDGDIVWEDDGSGSAPAPAQSSTPERDETANWGGESHGNQNTASSAPETNWWSSIFEAGSELGNSVHDALFGRSSAQESGQRATGDGKPLSEQKSGDQLEQTPAKSKGLFNDPQALLKMGMDGIAGHYKNQATRDAAALLAQGRTDELSQIEAQKVAAQQRYNDSFATPVARTGIIQTALKRINGQQVFNNGSLRK
jgi:hypothetical protein